MFHFPYSGESDSLSFISWILAFVRMVVGLSHLITFPTICYNIHVVNVKDKKLTKVAGTAKPDSKRRVVLPAPLVREGVTYNIYYNSAGQILLDPRVTIPASELWLFENKEALASIDRGMRESLSGKAKIKRGSFARYTKDAA